MVYVMQTQKGEQEGNKNYLMDAKQVVDLVNFVAEPEGWSTAGIFTLEMMVELGYNQATAKGQKMFQIRALQKETEGRATASTEGRATSSSLSQEPTECVIRLNTAG